MSTILTHQYDEGSSKVTVEIPRDATAVEVIEAVIGFMKAMTFAENSIYGAFSDALGDR